MIWPRRFFTAAIRLLYWAFAVCRMMTSMSASAIMDHSLRALQRGVHLADRPDDGNGRSVYALRDRKARGLPGGQGYVSGGAAAPRGNRTEVSRTPQSAGGRPLATGPGWHPVEKIGTPAPVRRSIHVVGISKEYSHV